MKELLEALTVGALTLLVVGELRALERERRPCACPTCEARRRGRPFFLQSPPKELPPC